jgi:hypothetical protein
VIGFILDINKAAWGTCVKSVKANMIPQHGNRYRLSGRGKEFNDHIKADLVSCLEDLQAEPRSTRVMRYIIGVITLRDIEEDIVFLSVGFSKRMLYVAFCSRECGYILEASSTKGYVATEVRDDALLILCWKRFCTIWKENFPKPRIGTAGKDICTDCHNYKNRFAFAAAQTAQAASMDFEEEALVLE